MKKFIIAAVAGSILCVPAIAQTNAEDKLVKVDEGVQASVIESLIKKYAKDDVDKGFIYKGVIENAFKDYFQSKNVQVDVNKLNVVVEKNQETKQLNDTITKLRKEIADLNSSKDLKLLETKEKAFQSSLDSLARAKDAEIAALTEELNKNSNDLLELRSEVTELRDKQKQFDGITEQLDIERGNFQNTYDRARNTDLANLKNAPQMIANVESYEKFMGLLKQNLSPDEQKQKQEVIAICSAAETFQGAQNALNQPYDRKNAADLLKKLNAIDETKLSAPQKKQIETAIVLLKNEGDVIEQFGMILDDILAQEFVDNNNSAEATDILNKGVKVYNVFHNADDPDNSEIFHSGYVYINGKVKELRNALKNPAKNGLNNEKTFKSFITNMKSSLENK